MLKHIKTLLERSAYFISSAITVLIVYLSLASISDVIVQINISDKILHILGYLTLALSWFFAIKKSHNNYKSKLWIAISIIIFGIILEVLQGSMMQNRTTDFYDIIANSIGIAIAFVSFNSLLRTYTTI